MAFITDVKLCKDNPPAFMDIDEAFEDAMTALKSPVHAICQDEEQTTNFKISLPYRFVISDFYMLS